MKKIFVILVAAFAVLLSSSAVSAQTAIISQLSKLEKQKDVEAVISERRNPSSGKIYKVSRVFIFRNSAYGKALLKAFEESRSKAVSYDDYRSGGLLTVTIVFQDNKGTRKYCLIKEGDQWTVTSLEVNQGNTPKGRATIEINLDDFPPGDLTTMFNAMPYEIWQY